MDRHALQVEAFGGSQGVRDMVLLESAVARPSMTFGGEFLHENLFAMAAAYLFHGVATTFLDLKGSSSTPRRRHG